jgi:hypothetical protein
MRHATQVLGDKRVRIVPSERVDPSWEGANLMELGQAMREHPNFASLGAIGPDLFFFLPDFRDENGVAVSSVLIRVLEFLERLYDAVDPYISKWEHYLGPISEDTAEEMSRLTGGLSETVGDIAGELAGILITALEDFFVQERDWWSFFSLGLNRGYDDQAAFWSDMLHYRQTGAFGKMLWRNADATGDDGARAYALGYLTHLATDVTGHALVNTVAGGPFRLHWQRHHLVENHMDADWYLGDPLAPRVGNGYPQITESALYFDIAFAEGTDDPVARPSYPAGNTLRDNWTRRRLLDVDSDLPESIAQLLIQTMRDVFYQDGNHPKILRENDGRPAEENIAEAYRLFFRILKLTTVDGFSHEPPPPPDVFPNLDFPTLTDPAADPPGEDDGSFWDDVLDFLLALVAVILYIVEVAVYLATLPWAILADVVTYPLRLGLYYALELPLFHILKNFRSALVMTGYLSPMQDEIIQPLICVGNTATASWQQVLGDLADVFGGLAGAGAPPVEDEAFRDVAYPHSHPDDEFHHPWEYPSSAPELLATTAGPHARGSAPPVLFVMQPADPVIRDGLEGATTPAEADSVGRDLEPRRHLGDAVSFSVYLIWLATRTDPEARAIVDWNLDADRGYGYHDWDWNRHAVDASFPAQPDPEGNLFAQPCTWPAQADHDLDPAAPISWNQAAPLKVHWVGPGLPDPGCDGPGAPIGRLADGPVRRARGGRRGGGR